VSDQWSFHFLIQIMSEEVKKTEAVEETTAPVTEETAAPAVEEVKEEEGEQVEIPAKFKTMVESIESMSVLDLHELVKLLEKKFGVSAAAVAVAGAGAGEAAEEKSEFDVELTSFGESKIPVMKAVKEVLGLGLKEAKELVESAPVIMKEAVAKEEAEELKAKIEEAGGKAELK
jgi:large subunit ribosomal protein L7/L12